MHKLPPLPTITPGRYRHYKGGEYDVIGVVRHSETLEPMVHYRPLSGDSGNWIRPFDMFLETVEIDGLPVPRFIRMQRSATSPAHDRVPPPTGTDLRRLDASDAVAFRALRLDGLRDMPTAFGSSFEEEQGRSVEQVQAHLTGSGERVFFGCFRARNLIGVVSVGREQGAKECHVGFVRGMIVAPEARGIGVGRALLDAALRQAFAWPGVEQLVLSVTASNAAAVQLYRSAGFVEVGRMPRALQIDGDYFDELIMLLYKLDR